MKTNSYTKQTLDNMALIIEKASETFISTLKIIYIISEKDFYNISVKDVFKVALTDITTPELLANLGIPEESHFKEEFAKNNFDIIKKLVFFYFAVRLPMINKNSEILLLSDRDINYIFDLCVKNGAENTENFIPEDLRFNIKALKQKNHDLTFDGAWFRKYCIRKGESFKTVDNKNMFFFGSASLLFSFFYADLIKQLEVVSQGNKLL